MTKLPEAYEGDTIYNMLPGDTGYTVPWAMWADENRDLRINGNYSVDREKGGTVQLAIRRTREGVVVDQSTIGDFKYTPGPRPYVLDDPARDLPVDLE